MRAAGSQAWPEDQGSQFPTPLEGASTEEVTEDLT